MKPVEVFVLVPSLVDASPVKGAVALANGLAAHFPVVFVCLKPGSGAPAGLDPAVELVRLGDVASRFDRLKRFRALLQAAGGRERAVSLSFCFSADALAWCMKPHARIISSVRGNLARNYRYTYGPTGALLAAVHYRLLRRFDTVLAMSGVMRDQLVGLGITQTKVVGNFVDEAALERCRINRKGRVGPFRFLFLGSLERRKRPDLLLVAARALAEQGVSFRLDIAGDGVLRDKLEALSRGLPQVALHGHVADSRPLVQWADCLVQPSESEGVSRSVLEALFYGVPCLLRDVEAASEIIQPGVNGALFARDADLRGAMAAMAAKGRVPCGQERPNLIPERFRQGPNIALLAEVLSRAGR